jgi:hypothetical protein
VKRLGYLLPAAVFATGSHAATAQSDPRFSVDVSVGGAVEANPFLQPEGDAAVSGRIEVTPNIVFEDEISSTRLAGNLRLSQYSAGYGLDEAARVSAASQRMLSERTSAHAQVSLQSSRRSLQDMLLPGATGFPEVINPEAGIPPDLPYIDPTIAGSRSRVTSVAGSLGVTTSLSARSSLGGNLNYGRSWFADDFQADYRRFGGQINYSRRLSERTVLTFGSSASRVDYMRTKLGDSTIIQPQLGFQRSIGERTTLNVGVGGSFVMSESQTGSREYVLLAGNASLCRRREFGEMCVSAQRTAQPTAYGRVTAVSNFAFNYNARVSRSGRLSLGAHYGKSEQPKEPVGPVNFPATDIVAGSATYYRSLTDRLTAFGTAGVSKIFADAQERDANVSFAAGITVRLGSLR